MPWVLLLIMGVIALTNVSQNPRFASFRATDVLTLLGSGMCFGVALVGLLTGLKPGR
jgi:hypothetical protein